MKTILNFSGGKDSTAMLLHLIEIGKRPDKIVFADTLMEYPEMYNYIDKIEKEINQKIIRTKPKNTFFKWFFDKWSRGRFKDRIRGFPFVVSPCWYQREAKVKPLEEQAKDFDVVYIGYAKGEEKRIMKSKKFKYPLIEWEWSEQDCINYLQKKGLLNPLYKKFKRLGCWCCPKQSKKSLEILKKDYPALWNCLIQLEELSPQGFNTNSNLNNKLNAV